MVLLSKVFQWLRDLFIICLYFLLLASTVILPAKITPVRLKYCFGTKFRYLYQQKWPEWNDGSVSIVLATPHGTLSRFKNAWATLPRILFLWSAQSQQSVMSVTRVKRPVPQSRNAVKCPHLRWLLGVIIHIFTFLCSVSYSRHFLLTVNREWTYATHETWI
jgi:hypothetical protein